MKQTIAIATSTRADWGLLTPLAAEMTRRGMAHCVLASNMHLMPGMGMTVKEIEAAGETPEIFPTAGTTPEETFAETVKTHAAWLRENSPQAIVILGDRYEMLAAASAAAMTATPIIHIAGGTVSEGAIDNAIRNAISQLSALHLAETELCASRLRAMGIPPGSIHAVGALGVWNACNARLMTRPQLEESLSACLPERFFVGTLHAATLDGSTPEGQMEAFLEGLSRFMAAHPAFGAILTYPNNDTDPEPLIARLKEFAARWGKRIVPVPSLGMKRYLSAVALSEGVIGNSSSGIVEVASLGVPTLDVGIRQKGRERAASVVHCDQTPESIEKGLETITSASVRAIAARKENPYASPDTPAAMARTIRDFLNHDEGRQKIDD